MFRLLPLLLLALVTTDAVAAAAKRDYELVYSMRLLPGRGGAEAAIRIGQGARAVREVRLHIDPDRHRDFSGDGEIRLEKKQLTWNPPRTGGTLRYFARLEHKRDKRGYDVRITDDWALFRGGDVFPPAGVRTLKGAEANARLRVELPGDWSVVTPYRETAPNEFVFDHPQRRFDRPTGWMLAGKIGVRRSTVAGTRVAVAAPEGQQARRMDTLAFLRWTLPAVRDLFPGFDERLLVVMAGDPMWRGGLSGPASLYLHARRPLISENATSTLLHELVHVAMSVSGSDHDDWIVEGLAEFYSLELLRRSRAISERRFARAIEDLRKWGAPVSDVFVRQATGPVKARAAVAMHGLDAAIASASGGTRRLDHVVRALLDADATLTYETLCTHVGALAPAALVALSSRQVPGARGERCIPPDNAQQQRS